MSHYWSEDIAQEAALSAWLSCDKFRGDCDFEGWLMRIVNNTGLNFRGGLVNTFRRSMVYDSQPVFDDIQGDLSHSEGPCNMLEAGRRLKLICDRLQAMKPAARDMFLKYRLTPISYQELVGQVPKYKSRLTRATARLLEIE
jgi:DNA-directed RNA polymerase specialized sigma24 family protein